MKIYTLFQKIEYTSEQIILFGLLQKPPNDKVFNYNFNTQSRYHNLIEFCKQKYEYVTEPQKCDIIVLPYKFINLEDQTFKDLHQISKDFNKPLWCFYNDDNHQSFNLPENVFLFRTSIHQSEKNKNEFSLVPIFPDYFNNYIFKSPKLSIGFCGHKLFGREKYLNLLEQSKIKTNFLIRDGFWAPGIEKIQARQDFINNIKDNLFTFCFRGEGNFSYRFYETLMMGRIPIVINTNCSFPFWDIIKNENIGLFIDENEIISGNKNLIQEIINFYTINKDDLITIQKNNRKIWELYYSATGYLTKLGEKFNFF